MKPNPNQIKTKTWGEFKMLVEKRFEHVVGRRVEFLNNKARVHLTSSRAPVKLTWVQG